MPEIPDITLPTPGQHPWAEDLNADLTAVNDGIQVVNDQLADLDTVSAQVAADAATATEQAGIATSQGLLASQSAVNAQNASTQAGESAQAAAESASIAGVRNRADAILRGAPKTPDAVYALSSETVTMTIGLASGAVTSTIAGSHWRALKRTAPGATSVDIAGDSTFWISGTPALTYGTNLPDNRYVTAPLLIGGAAQSARYTPLYRFNYDGRYLEMSFKCVTAAAVSFRVKVDGRYITPTGAGGTVLVGGGEDIVTLSANSAGNLAAGSGYLVKLDFATAKPRLIEFEGPSSFGGIWVEPTATVTKGAAPNLVAAGIGDSIEGGAGSSKRSENWILRAGNLIGCDEVHNLAIGGSGYTVAPGVSNYLLRIPDLVAINPDIIFIDGGQNDQGANTVDFAASVNQFFSAVKESLPDAIVAVMGMWTPGNASVTRITMNEIIRAACLQYGFGLVDVIDPTGLGRTSPIWATATVYSLGSIVLNGTTPVICTTAHTSAATYDATKWQATSWIYGTGRVGATTGDGNADLLIQSDGIHQMPAANDMIERRFAQSVLEYLKILAEQ